MNPLITVVVPTCRRPALLRNCLQALAQQKLTPSQFEVIVVDQANDRTTAALVREVARQTGLYARYLSQPEEIGLAAAYNRGWRAAQSLFVVFTQDDCLPQPLWLTTALPLFHKGAQAIIGRVEHRLPKKPLTGTVMANLFCRRALLEQVSGFDESIDTKQLDQIDWLDKLAQIGVPIISCPDAVVTHGLPTNTSWLSSLRSTLYKLLFY
ncbi:glycosyltransferase family 2 protein [Fibrivirga algicola]|uniref:Glycosyltransferase n=1 Tax=Fibrivirga algicola TaxID=2950420 RepID=A0ABX0QFM3_9BACT|nr:glycosyltransferase family A protein [Fibrivirga algicola]ARK11965.1 hypothetical protein A6C57_17425 [Fibrella sp. ES10-3-2-2]NID11215.1 glycosyltransferase [Fibrivirga algicola]